MGFRTDLTSHNEHRKMEEIDTGLWENWNRVASSTVPSSVTLIPPSCTSNLLPSNGSKSKSQKVTKKLTA